MKSLYLLRHAEAARGRATDEDFDCPLLPRGRAAAERLSETMAAEGIRPELVICSGARRARETWEILSERLSAEDGEPIILETLDDLYLATMTQLLTILRAAPGDTESVLMIGHNPGLQQFAGRLAGPDSEDGALQKLRKGLPGGGFVVLSLEGVDWARIKPGSARLERVLFPADLPVPG